MFRWFKRKHRFDPDQFVEILHSEVKFYIKRRDKAILSGNNQVASECQITCNILFGIHNAIVGIKVEEL